MPPMPIRSRQKASSFPRRRSSQLWSDTVDSLSQDLSAKEIKRQEVIYEMTQGEKQLIEDLNLVKKVYYEPMLKLDIMTESELGQIFGTLDSLIPLHEDFLARLEGLRGSEKTVGEVGPTLLDWFPCLDAYITYCCNQVGAKALLDQKKQVRRVEEFLRLCQESSFSRKLDLWNFLDLPRSRLVKYPLLLKEIQKSTPHDHPDEDTLPQAMELIQSIITEVNRKTGEAECQFYKRGLSYPEEGQRVPEIHASRFLYCHGELKSTKGQKLHVFLFELVLVLTRPVVQDKEGMVQFQVYRQPLPAAQILLEDLPDGEASSSGSFRSTFTGNDKVFIFRSSDLFGYLQHFFTFHIWKLIGHSRTFQPQFLLSKEHNGSMPRAQMDSSCQALCRSLVSQNENIDISQSVLYTSLMGLLLVADKEREQTLGNGQVGLYNTGNTCFLNAIVQCLSHTQGLRDYCLSKTYLQDMCSSREPELMNEFTKVLEGLWCTGEGKRTVNPDRFYRVFKEALPYFSGYSQQDAHEFLRFLLDRLHTEINRRPAHHTATTPEPSYTRSRISEEAAAMWKRYVDKDDSIIVDLFSGQLRSSLHCSVCSHFSNTFDVFCDLSLPIPKTSDSRAGVTLRECLDLFSHEEKLSKENSPMCETCNRCTETTKSLTIQRFPKILVIHLKRFTASRYSIRKSTVPVSFPLTGLDLGPFGPSDCGPVLYDLYALCDHMGTVNMGHYTAVCQDEDGWCCYNDSCVTQISADQLQSNEAYLLFYRLKHNMASRK
ncbi:hypothetical protein QTP86_015625 [Hemibagrus guttatus]|nr:hypothetical protein QTP86_015625 [Hemibagrus guttatus]